MQIRHRLRYSMRTSSARSGYQHSERKYRHRLPDKDHVYCRSGNRSKQASKKLVDLGYRSIVEFGGILDWTGKTVQ